MGGRLRGSSRLVRAKALRYFSGKQKAWSTFPFQDPNSHFHVLNRREGAPRPERGLHPEALVLTHKRHILIGFQNF